MRLELAALVTQTPSTPFAVLASTLRLVVIFKLLLATLLGGAVGIERELSNKPAGLRTNILICIGAALFTQLSIDIAQVGFTPDGRPYGDTTRIAAQIVSGIGFLGAGAILHAEGAIVGLTSAATVWVVAAIGAAIGAGAYIDALGGTAFIVLVLVGMRPLERRLLTKRRRIRATLRVRPGVGFAAMEDLMQAQGIHVFSHRTFEHEDDRTFELHLVGATQQFDLMVDTLRRNKDVISIVTE